jgi:hypothetical protein
MKRITVHIGLPKTATTKLREVFSAHPNVIYLGPNAGYSEIDIVFKDLCFLDSLSFESQACADIVATFLSGFPNRKPFVASFDNISNLGRDRVVKAERLKTLFPDAGVVITVRRPEDLMMSAFFQQLKGFGEKLQWVPEFSVWLHKEWSDHGRGNFQRLQFAKLLRTYRSLFGHDNVLLLFFEEIVADRFEFSSKLSRFIGIDAEITAELLSEEKVNPRMTSLRYTEISLYSRMPWLRKLEKARSFVPPGIKQLIRGTMGNASAELSPEWRKKIRDYARLENGGLLDEFPQIRMLDYF